MASVVKNKRGSLFGVVVNNRERAHVTFCEDNDPVHMAGILYDCMNPPVVCGSNRPQLEGMDIFTWLCSLPYFGQEKRLFGQSVDKMAHEMSHKMAEWILTAERKDPDYDRNVVRTTVGRLSYLNPIWLTSGGETVPRFVSRYLGPMCYMPWLVPGTERPVGAPPMSADEAITLLCGLEPGEKKEPEPVADTVYTGDLIHGWPVLPIPDRRECNAADYGFVIYRMSKRQSHALALGLFAGYKYTGQYQRKVSLVFNQNRFPYLGHVPFNLPKEAFVRIVGEYYGLSSTQEQEEENEEGI